MSFGHLSASAVTTSMCESKQIGLSTGLGDSGESHLQMEGDEGEPSRWNTLRAMRVLHWFGQGGSST